MTINYGISRSNLIALTDIDSSTYNWVSSVREMLPFQEARIKEVCKDDREISRYLFRIKKKFSGSFPPLYGGVGYLSSSVQYEVEKEKLWTAVVSSWLKESPRPFHPLVVPVDEFYSYLPGSPTWSIKVKFFSQEGIYDRQGKPYVLLISGFSQSKFYTAENLEKIPLEDKLDVGLRSQLVNFSLHTLSEKLENRRSVYLVREEMRNEALGSGANPSRADLLLTAALTILNGDFTDWQNFQEVTKPRVPLYIIAPKTFHDAINRMSRNTRTNYQQRVDYSLGAFDIPILGINEPLPPPLTPSVKNFEEQVKPILHLYRKK